MSGKEGLKRTTGTKAAGHLWRIQAGKGEFLYLSKSNCLRMVILVRQCSSAGYLRGSVEKYVGQARDVSSEVNT